MKPGRNVPCPCGSGKKYKHCCLAAEQQAEQSPDAVTCRRVRRATEAVGAVLAGFVDELYGRTVIDEAWDQFTLWTGDGVVDPESPFFSVFFPWLFHCWEPEAEDDESSLEDESLSDRPPTQVFLERRGARLDPLLRRYLEACLKAPFSFHEVLAVNPGRGFTARDLISDLEQEVFDRAASESLADGDVLYAQLVPIDGIVVIEGISPLAFSPIDKIAIVELRERIETHSPSDGPLVERAREWDWELRELFVDWMNALLDGSEPVLHNTDGELVLPQRVAFDIDSAETAFEALKHLAGLENDAEGLSSAARTEDGRLERVRFSWLRADGSTPEHRRTVLGFVEIEDGGLVAEVNSTERANAFRRIVEEALGAQARYRGTEVASESSPFDEAAVSEEQEALAEAPEVRAAMNDMLASHYEEWVTTEIPALGNRRPIDVVKDRTGRQKVAALVEQFERDSRCMTPPPDESVFKRLRERLGLHAD